MARILILIVFLASFQSRAGDWSSSWPTLNKIQLAGLVLLGSLSVNALAASNNTSATQVLCTDQFIIASTWLGNFYGIIDTVAWALDFLSGYIFYAKGDTKDVKRLKKSINKIKEKHHKTHQERISITIGICDKIITYIESEEFQHNNHESSRSKDEIVDCINYAREILHKEIENRDNIRIIL